MRTMKNRNISTAIAYLLLFAVLTLAVVYPPVRWLVLGILFSVGYAVILRRRLLPSEFSLVSAFLGGVTTLIIWVIARNL